jgi:glycerol-3-phosphate dehydrogenase
VTRRLRTRVLVIGGGINGTGIARDLALRGVPCVLAERRELGSGTSWASSGMIHGGLRYLQKDPEVTQHSCVDSGAIQRIAPHLVFRIPFLMPVFPDDPLGPELVEIGLEMYDRFVPLKNGRPHTRLTRAQALALEPALSDRIECAFTLDEWGVDAARLCMANALDAADRGATVLTHTEAVELLRDGSGRVVGARLRDRIRGDEAFVEAELVMNATGPWSPQVARLAGEELRLRPGKGIHLVFERRVSNLAIYAKGVDGRDMFTFPHEQNSMAGTTDDDYYGDLDRIDVIEDEVAYVLQAMQRSIPSIRSHRVLHAIQGVRPTLFGFGAYEDELSRDYAILDHGERGGAPGLLSITRRTSSAPRSASPHRAARRRCRCPAARRRPTCPRSRSASASGSRRRRASASATAPARAPCSRPAKMRTGAAAAPCAPASRCSTRSSATRRAPRASASSPTARCACASASARARAPRAPRRRRACSRKSSAGTRRARCARWRSSPRTAGGRWRRCSAARRWRRWRSIAT